MNFIDWSIFTNLWHTVWSFFFPPKAIVSISMNAADWTIGPIVDGVNDSHNMPLNPTPEAGGWGFDFPPEDGVHYVTVAQAGKLSGTLVATFTITGTGKLTPSPNGGTSAPKARLYFQRAGDDWATTGYRWWSAPSTLEVGTHSLSIPLNFINWIGGLQAGVIPTEAEFQAALADVANIGITFGADFAGHGLYSVGPVHFSMKAFTVTP